MPQPNILSLRTYSKLFVGVLALAGLSSVAVTARADDDRPSRHEYDDHPNRRDREHGKTHIALDFDFGSVLDNSQTTSGGGGALRLGEEFDMLLVSLTPEFGGSYHAF